MQWFMSIALLALCDARANKMEVEKTIEHKVEPYKAESSAHELHREEEPNRAGCASCTWEDFHYCRGRNILIDHCCCDRKHQEPFNYIPHECYMEDVPLCQPFVADCEEYLRLDVCCCQPILRDKYASSVSLQTTSAMLIIILKLINMIMT